MISGDCNFRLGTKKASRELRSGLEGDVFFLDRGIDRDFHLLGGFPVQRHRNFKDQARSIFADSFAKIDEVRGIAGKLPLETGFATKGLKIGIGHLGFDHPLVAQILKRKLPCRLSRDFAFMTAPRSAQKQPVSCGITAVPGRGQYIDSGFLLSFFRMMDRFQGRLA